MKTHVETQWWIGTILWSSSDMIGAISEKGSHLMIEVIPALRSQFPVGFLKTHWLSLEGLNSVRKVTYGAVFNTGKIGRYPVGRGSNFAKRASPCFSMAQILVEVDPSTPSPSPERMTEEDIRIAAERLTNLQALRSLNALNLS